MCDSYSKLFLDMLPFSTSNTKIHNLNSFSKKFIASCVVYGVLSQFLCVEIVMYCTVQHSLYQSYGKRKQGLMCPVFSQHRFGGTPLSEATMTTHYNAVEILLKHGAGHYVKDNDGISQNESTTTCESTGALVGVILEYNVVSDFNKPLETKVTFVKSMSCSKFCNISIIQIQEKKNGVGFQ